MTWSPILKEKIKGNRNAEDANSTWFQSQWTTDLPLYHCQDMRFNIHTICIYNDNQMHVYMIPVTCQYGKLRKINHATRLNAILDLRSLVGHEMSIPREDSRHHLLLWLVACSEALWWLTHLTSKQDWVKTNQWIYFVGKYGWRSLHFQTFSHLGWFQITFFPVTKTMVPPNKCDLGRGKMRTVFSTPHLPQLQWSISDIRMCRDCFLCR